MRNEKRDLMRIICPGCDAQYEVPDEVIPGEGRDVQCSSCGTTWMFGPPGQAASPPSQAEADDATSRPDEDDESADGDLAADMPRRELDPKVASILRAEAARESAARAADARPEPLEMQPDLGLTEAPRPQPAPEAGAAAETPASPAPRHPDTAETGNMTVAAATAAAGSRRERLPDIEEINSTLRSSGDRGMAADDLDPDAQDRLRRRRGFRLGALTALLVFVACLLVYQFAPEIATSVPQADPWLSSYVTWVDDMRTELDSRARQALDWLDAQAAASDE